MLVRPFCSFIYSIGKSSLSGPPYTQASARRRRAAQSLCFRSQSISSRGFPTRGTCRRVSVGVTPTPDPTGFAERNVVFAPWKSKTGVCGQGQPLPRGRDLGHLRVTAPAHERGGSRRDVSAAGPGAACSPFTHVPPAQAPRRGRPSRHGRPGCVVQLRAREDKNRPCARTCVCCVLSILKLETVFTFEK